MFGFTCVPLCKPNKFWLGGVLSEQCSDLLACFHVNRTNFGWAGCYLNNVWICLQLACHHVWFTYSYMWGTEHYAGPVTVATTVCYLFHRRIALLYIIILSHFSNLYVFSFKRCLVLYVLHYIYVLHSYICMYVHKFWRVAAFDCLRTNPNFARFAGVIRQIRKASP